VTATFVTVGSSHLPFPRLMDALEALPGDGLVVQHGPAPPPSQAAVTVDFLPFEAVQDHMARAEIVLCHAGVGSIMTALRLGHVPVVVPRLRRFAETVDDHQLELAAALDAVGRVVLVQDLDRLPQHLATAPPRRPPSATGPGALHHAVRQALLGAR
jgi:UDP-N-acetylglucosamine transferase subunit ALG13